MCTPIQLYGGVIRGFHGICAEGSGFVCRCRDLIWRTHSLGPRRCFHTSGPIHCGRAFGEHSTWAPTFAVCACLVLRTCILGGNGAGCCAHYCSFPHRRRCRGYGIGGDSCGTSYVTRGTVSNPSAQNRASRPSHDQWGDIPSS